jgi:hypothetical protein
MLPLLRPARRPSLEWNDTRISYLLQLMVLEQNDGLPCRQTNTSDVQVNPSVALHAGGRMCDTFYFRRISIHPLRPGCNRKHWRNMAVRRRINRNEPDTVSGMGMSWLKEPIPCAKAPPCNRESRPKPHGLWQPRCVGAHFRHTVIHCGTITPPPLAWSSFRIAWDATAASWKTCTSARA